MDNQPSCNLLFIDSGAHSLYTQEVIRKRKKAADKYEYFTLKKGSEFREFVDNYAAFIKKNHKVIDYYVNVDVIFHPEKSWEVLEYLEKEHGLNPLPVIHYGTPLKWVAKHLEKGYDFLGIGGLGQEVRAEMYLRWADGLYREICPGPRRIPIVKTHGFAMTGYSLMVRYPWWSVDSSTWIKLAAFGSVMVPKRSKGVFDFGKPPYTINMSERSLDKSSLHGLTLSPNEKREMLDWCKEINLDLASLSTDWTQRALANLIYFQRLVEWLPKWPWPIRYKEPAGFGFL